MRAKQMYDTSLHAAGVWCHVLLWPFIPPRARAPHPRARVAHIQVHARKMVSALDAAFSSSWGPVPYRHPVVNRRSNVLNDTLSLLAAQYGTDKGSPHQYTKSYTSVMGPARLAVRRFLEIGVDRGASVKMWHDWLPNAEVTGLDWFHCVKKNSQCTRGDLYSQWSQGRLASTHPRIKVAHVNQSDDAAMHAFIVEQQKLAPFDIIVEDGSHKHRDQQRNVAMLFPLVRPGGLYVIEDVHTGFEAGYDEVRNSQHITYNVFCRVNQSARMRGQSKHWSSDEAAYLERWMQSAELVVTRRFNHDMTSFLRKRTSPHDGASLANAEALALARNATGPRAC